jgi:hypothetical protein
MAQGHNPLARSDVGLAATIAQLDSGQITGFDSYGRQICVFVIG